MLAGERLALWGHSLGGHIVSKYVAIFPERVEAIVMIEGLGVPNRARESDEVAEMQVLQFMILNGLRQQQRRCRPIQNEAEAEAARICVLECTSPEKGRWLWVAPGQERGREELAP